MSEQESNIERCQKCGRVMAISGNYRGPLIYDATEWCICPSELAQKQESNVCAICGGVKRVDWTISFEECHPVKMQFDPASLVDNWRLCPGHPEPAPKHDGEFGRLDENGSRVWHDPSWGYDCVGIALHDGERCYIRPKQALSLLVWLEQEKPELERLAKEQVE